MLKSTLYMIAAFSGARMKYCMLPLIPEQWRLEIDFAVSINACATAGPVIILHQLKRQITLKEKYKQISCLTIH